MKTLDKLEVVQISGAGFFGFWESLGGAIGSYVASNAYDSHSKSLHDIGTGKSDTTLDEYLASQNDPLL